MLESLSKYNKIGLVFLTLLVFAITLLGCSKLSTLKEDATKFNPKRYQEEATKSSCAANQRNIKSALYTYYTDKEGWPASLDVLVPEYLQSLPKCPSKGTYSFKIENEQAKVSCSVHRSLIE